MKILVVNDDGIDSPNLKYLATIAKKYGEVFVVAPDGVRSSTSHKVSYSDYVDCYSVDLGDKDIKAYKLSGSPVDCVRIGIEIVGCKPDLLLSGINNGLNISYDTQYSATVAAALEGAFYGIHSIAFSMDLTNDYSLRDKYVPSLLDKYMNIKLDKDQIWNINLPACSLNELKGIYEDVILSKDEYYLDEYECKVIDNNHSKYKVIPKRNYNGTKGTDLYAVTNNYISVGKLENFK